MKIKIEAKKSAKKPKYWNSMFAVKVLNAYDSGDLTFDNISEWETEYNDGVKPNPSLNTKEILNYYLDGHDIRIKESTTLKSSYSPQDLDYWVKEYEQDYVSGNISTYEIYDDVFDSTDDIDLANDVVAYFEDYYEDDDDYDDHESYTDLT